MDLRYLIALLECHTSMLPMVGYGTNWHSPSAGRTYAPGALQHAYNTQNQQYMHTAGIMDWALRIGLPIK